MQITKSLQQEKYVSFISIGSRSRKVKSEEANKSEEQIFCKLRQQNFQEIFNWDACASEVDH